MSCYCYSPCYTLCCSPCYRTYSWCSPCTALSCYRRPYGSCCNYKSRTTRYYYPSCCSYSCCYPYCYSCC